MPLTTVLFDLDGTLIDSIPLIKLTFQHVFEELGIPWGNGEVLKTIGLPLRDVAASYAGERAAEFLEIYAEFQRKNQKRLLKPYPGAEETLSNLQKMGCRIGVVTSKRRGPTRDGLSLTGLERYPEVVVTVEDIRRPKPDPDGILVALELLQALPEEAVYIGDSVYDILTGKNAGVTTVAVAWGIASEEELKEKKPDFFVRSWDELNRLCAALSTGDGMPAGLDYR